MSAMKISLSDIIQDPEDLINAAIPKPMRYKVRKSQMVDNLYNIEFYRIIVSSVSVALDGSLEFAFFDHRQSVIFKKLMEEKYPGKISTEKK